MMTFKVAQGLVKDRALGKYHYRAVQLLSKLVLNTYSKTQPERDIETVTISKRIVTIKGWLGGISDRQLRTLFAQVEEIKVVKREPNKITVLLNLEPLRNAESGAAIAKRNTAEHKADRAAKARAQRAENRKATRLTDAAKAMRETKERFFDVVLHPISAATRRKHASLPYKAEQPAAADAGGHSDEPTTRKAVTLRRRGPIKVATAHGAL